ncbi:hypothetical protein EBN88_26940 [Streptomyces triticirhizae]|uniref:Uncharacterized protein n=1 Tax=Streptomyces triticirhizae TaxID=2483353 RepID=A0A3M2L6T0_9ACTN|nr:hypothetical protein EBN88_26940 [Streptomyces triticirhizae]
MSVFLCWGEASAVVPCGERQVDGGEVRPGEQFGDRDQRLALLAAQLVEADATAEREVTCRVGGRGQPAGGAVGRRVAEQQDVRAQRRGRGRLGGRRAGRGRRVR